MRTLNQTLKLLAAACLLASASTAVADSVLAVGDLVPAYAMEGTDGQMHRQDDAGWKVIAWYPKAYTSGCTIECKSLTEQGHLIQAFDVAYFMASVDPLADASGFATQQGADFPLLADPDKVAAAAFGVLSGSGYAKRHTFYVDGDGVIVAIDRSVKPKTSAEDIAATLAGLGAPRAAGLQEKGN